MFRPSASTPTAIAAAVPIVLDEAGEPVGRMRLLPIGPLILRDGRKFTLPADTADAALAVTRGYHGATDMVVDYDHHSEGAQSKGTSSRASGWVEPAKLTREADGIYGEVAWTAAARAAIKDREFRYLSPTFWFDKLGNVLGLKSVALLNNPAMDGLPALASTQETVMLNKIALALGLPETATEEEIVAAIAALEPADAVPAPAMAAVATALGLAATATPAEIATAAAAKPSAEFDATKFVPIEQLQAANARLSGIEAAATATAASQAVDTAVAAGKIAPASRDHFLKSAEKDLPGFVALAASMPVIFGVAGLQGKLVATAGTLDDEERGIARDLSLTDAEYLAVRNRKGA